MKNVWRFKIDLIDQDIFREISIQYGMEFPVDLKEFIIHNNAASPVKNGIDIRGTEKVYSETLSFNKIESDATTFSEINNTFSNRSYIPFAIDPFGNIFCYSLKTGFISFYDHEEDTIMDTNMNLKVFLESLR